ncbi:ABC transporter substrate-binding protein [Ottowia thiooxydans]|uniref:Branched-chain amino acid transport system substrate-binding protein n=1 Tax=Ottowia thiooxydans TaxID=219182 RepID=A0ABV2QAN3_9BURK
MLKNPRLSRLAVIALAAGMGTAMAQDVGVTATEILLGEVQPMSGPASLIGKAGAAGSKLAIAEINAKGGINGRKLRAIYEDDGYVPARSVTAVKKLIDSEKVFALTGTTGSSHMVAMLPTIEEAKIPTIVHMAPNPAVVSPRRPTVFMIGPDYDLAGFVPVSYMVEKLGQKSGKFGILYQDDDFGKALLAGYQKAVKQHGVTSVAEIPFKRGAKDFSAEVLSLKEKGITAVYLGTLTTESAAVMAEFRRLGMKPVIGTLWAGQLPAAVKLAAPSGFEYLIPDYYASNYDPAGIKLMALAKQHLNADDYANFNRYTVSGYVGTQVLAEGIRRCGPKVTRVCVVEQLNKLKDYNTGGLTGPVSFDNPKAQAVLPIKLFQTDPKNATVRSLTDFIAY